MVEGLYNRESAMGYIGGLNGVGVFEYNVFEYNWKYFGAMY
jgi:hypothetical protein